MAIFLRGSCRMFLFDLKKGYFSFLVFNFTNFFLKYRSFSPQFPIFSLKISHAFFRGFLHFFPQDFSTLFLVFQFLTFPVFIYFFFINIFKFFFSKFLRNFSEISLRLFPIFYDAENVCLCFFPIFFRCLFKIP